MLPDIALKIIEQQKVKESGKEISEEEAKELMRKQDCSEEYIEKTFKSTESKLASLGVPEDSTLYEFYTNIGFIPLGQGEELNTLDGIIEHKESEFHEEEYPGIYERFLQLSSIEGEGSYFYEIETGIVYDADWGEEEAMTQGTLEKKWSSFYSFLEWYYSPEEQ